MKDIFDKCEEFLSASRRLDRRDRALAAGLFASVSPPANAGPWIAANGRKLLQFSSNDYLGLAMHPEVRARALEIVHEYGVCSPMGSRLLTGTTELHLELERKLAVFKRCEGAVTFPTGAMAMIGMLACLAGPGDLLVLDEHAHATLVCGARISGAKIAYFRHNDVEHLEGILCGHASAAPRAIVVDGVYSMQGDVAPLAELAVLKRKYGARLIVDDAHGTGVFGEHGRGTAAHLGVESEIDLQAGTFSKALGTIGGFVAGDAAVVEYIRYHAPTYIFSKAMPLAVAAATLKALELLQEADDRRRRLWENARRLQAGLKARGFDLGRTQSPITPVHAAGNDALYMAGELRTTYDIWAAPVIYPAVRLGASILRLIPTAMHGDAEIDSLVDALATVRGAMILGSMPMV